MISHRLRFWQNLLNKEFLFTNTTNLMIEFVLPCPFVQLPVRLEQSKNYTLWDVKNSLYVVVQALLKKGSKVGEIIVPVAVVRDEGTSYHYLEPSREVECHKETTVCRDNAMACFTGIYLSVL